MPQITIAMITMNEEKAVAKVIDDIRKAVKGHDAEILLVDSSKDATPEIAAAKGARVVRQFPPQGYGRAMGRALSEARGKVVVTLDCDDTYPTSDILPFAAKVLSGEWDIVSGSRLRRKPDSMPLSNYIGNRVFAITGWLVTGVKSTDLHTGMRAYSKALLDDVDFELDGAALPVELMLKPALLGYRVQEVFINYHDRIGDSTLHKWDSTMWTFKRIFRLFRLRFVGAAARKVTTTQ
jgi:glycosyltransferase involved in cell wall biosynthesis